MSEVNIRDPQVVASMQRGYEAALPRILRHARIRLADIRDPGRRDDAIADVVGIGWVHYIHCVEQGKKPEDFISTIADFAVRQVRVGRHVTPQDTPNDVMSRRAQRTRGFAVQVFPEHTGTGTDENEAIDALADTRHASPADQAAFKIDVGEWLGSLGAKRPIIEDMMLGEGTGELAQRSGKSHARISQMRREAHQSWNRMHEGR